MGSYKDYIYLFVKSSHCHVLLTYSLTDRLIAWRNGAVALSLSRYSEAKKMGNQLKAGENHLMNFIKK